MSKSTEQLNIRLESDEKKKISDLAEKEEKTIREFVLEKCLSDNPQDRASSPIQLIPCLSIKMNDPEPIPIEEIIIKLDEHKRDIIKRKLILEQYYDVSYDCYFYFIISYVSAITGSTYEEYIRDHLKYAKKFPKMEDVWRNFPYMGKYESEYAIEILMENRVRNINDFDKYVAKIKERCKEQIEKYVRNNDIKPV